MRTTFLSSLKGTIHLQITNGYFKTNLKLKKVTIKETTDTQSLERRISESNFNIYMYLAGTIYINVV